MINQNLRWLLDSPVHWWDACWWLVSLAKKSRGHLVKLVGEVGTWGCDLTRRIYSQTDSFIYVWGLGCRFTVWWEQCGAPDPRWWMGAFSCFNYMDLLWGSMMNHDPDTSMIQWINMNQHLHFSLPLELRCYLFPFPWCKSVLDCAGSLVVDAECQRWCLAAKGMKHVGSRKRAQRPFDVYWKILEVQVKCIQ